MQGEWQYSTVHNCPCKVIEKQTLWGQEVFRVWLPNHDAVVRLPSFSLRPLNDHLQPEKESARIAYIAAAAKVAEILEGSGSASNGHVLLAPMESNVIPLPHQIHALSRAISGDRIRYLLADEVGLGKTIEAGLIMRELKLRGLAKRILVVAPKGLTTQWIAEMRTHFNESFRLVLGDDIGALQRLVPDADNRSTMWSMFDQVVVSLDSVKPLDRRRGWTEEKIAEYNRDRFDGLITAGWDLVIVDEAHRLGGSTDQVARYKLGRGLAEAAPYVLLLSATPHQGKTDAFHRLMSLLDDNAFPDQESVSHDRVAPYVIRTEKRKAIDADGNPLFKPRHTQMIPVRWETKHHLQQLLYESVTDYVREGYNQALQEKKRHIGFLMILMQRLVISSTRAIRTTLERRIDALKNSEKNASLRLEEMDNNTEIPDDLFDMNGQELLDELLKSHISALRNESSHVESLLEAARQCEQEGSDAKAEALIDWIYKLQAEENEPDLKILIFTEFIPTQEMLKEFLTARGIHVVTLNGSMDMDERTRTQNAFRDHARVLISTDAGGEGLNLQFSHVIINYDIPWNPMRLEQRIGRVDRIGQMKTVRAINFLFEESVEFRVREVLEEKLAIIFSEFGIDKTGDVLDSAQAGEIFEDVFASAILNPDGIEKSVDQTVEKIRTEIQQTRQSSAIFNISDEPDVKAAERLRSHPLPHWIEKMVIGYLNSHDGSAIRRRHWWDLTWPDGREFKKSVFSSREINRSPDIMLLNLENSRIRGLALNLPQIAAGQPLPCVILNDLPPTIRGIWGLFEIRLQAGNAKKATSLHIPLVRRTYISIFLSEGKIFLPTARHIWDAIQTTEPKIIDELSHEESESAYAQLTEAAEHNGHELFEALRQEHMNSLAREEERGMVAFKARHKAIERIGLPEVRQYRISKCISDEMEWKNELSSAKKVLPEIRPLLMMSISNGVAP